MHSTLPYFLNHEFISSMKFCSSFLLLQARSLLKKGHEEIPIDLLNNIGVLHFEREEYEVCKLL